MFPSWPVSSPEPHASRPSAHSFSAPAGQHLPFPFTSHSGQPVNRQMLFFSFGFPDAKTRGAYFFSIQSHRFRLDRPISPTANPLFISVPQPPTRQLISFLRQPAAALPSYFHTLSDRQHIPFRRQPANTSRHHSFHTGPTILNQPTPFLPAWPADALHHFPLLLQHLQSTIFPPSIAPHHSSKIHQLPSSPTSSRRISSISTSPLRPSTHLPFFLFFISPSTSFRSSPFRTYISPLSQRPPLLPSCCRFSNPQAAEVAGDEPAFLFSFLFFIFLPYLPGAAASPRRLLFSFYLCFYFFLLFFFVFFLLFLFFFFIFLLSLSSSFLIFFPVSNLFHVRHFFFFSFFYFIRLLFSSSFFLFFYSSLSNLSHAHRQPSACYSSFFLFSLLFFHISYSPPCSTCLPSVIIFLFLFFFFLPPHPQFHPPPLQLPSGSSKKKKKYRQKNPRGLNGLPGANGRRKERQRDGMG